MTVNVQDHRSMLLQTDDEFRQLAARHKELEHRLSELAGKSHLTEPEHLEQVTIKKRKLLLKDRMEDMVRRFADTAGSELSA
ncbi:MAG: YdcH family protein [Vicinamibacterales bacterium]